MKKEPEIPPGYLRVTEVLQPFSTLGGIDPKTVANAADRGTRVHAYCEAHALDLFVEEYEDDCKNYVECFKRWFDEMVINVLHTEVRLNSPAYRISGAFDLMVVLKGDTCATLVDIKTPASSSLSWQLQTAAYQLLSEEVLNLRPERRICLMLPKTGDRVTIKEYMDHDRDQELYIKALELYRFFKG